MEDFSASNNVYKCQLLLEYTINTCRLYWKINPTFIPKDLLLKNLIPENKTLTKIEKKEIFIKNKNFTFKGSNPAKSIWPSKKNYFNTHIIL